MPPKTNSKALAARERKAEVANAKAAKVGAEIEAVESEEWSKGAKGKSGKDDKAEKAKEVAARKAANAKLLAEEEAALKASKASVAKTGPSKPSKPAKPSSATPAIPVYDAQLRNDGIDEPDAFTASNIDDALDVLSLVNEKKDKAAEGSRAAIAVDTHPERRFKAAFEAYKDAELPQLRKDRPGLRLQQYHDVLYKDFQKSPLNPFNQLNTSFNASKSDKVEALRREKETKESRLRADAA